VHLEVMGSLAQLLASGPADRVHPVCDLAGAGTARVVVGDVDFHRPLVAVSTGLAQRLAAEDQPWAAEQALFPRSREAVVRSAGVPGRGEPAVQHGRHVPDRPRRDVAGRHAGHLGEVAADRDHVHVTVDQSG